MQKPSKDFAQDSRSPAGHFAHTTQLVCFDAFWYLLASQSVHDAAAEVAAYLPTPHSVHVEAPALVPVFVIEPAAQLVHDATLEAVEYLPATHGVHASAPVLVPASVIDPATHSEQYDLPPSD